MPAAGKTNWNDTETWQRLMAAVIASGVKLNLNDVAKYFGTTYDTLENRLRKVKKVAKELEAEVTSGERSAVVTSSRTKSATSTPRKPKATKDALSTVTNGRVTKTPSPKKKTVKQEKVGEDADAGLDDVDIFDGIDFGVDSGDAGMHELNFAS